MHVLSARQKPIYIQWEKKRVSNCHFMSIVDQISRSVKPPYLMLAFFQKTTDYFFCLLWSGNIFVVTRYKLFILCHEFSSWFLCEKTAPQGKKFLGNQSGAYTATINTVDAPSSLLLVLAEKSVAFAPTKSEINTFDISTSFGRELARLL